ncbi:class I SAM-dependent methyltransferase [Magnetospirillum sp. 64-120]|uniref:class I SAM-dependent methyltransferase n=1 Tax=Magnetospirillum sp. 64-120 TaxID=1895778 RepID=UPI00092674BF|nr:class I SAM-dependent methyltransferase [Magnetospirillum sp. 64-120]OJX68181.1 MAG: hypothetical protein BGO92_05880 [Magnetospirillum sp. 64-120]
MVSETAIEQNLRRWDELFQRRSWGRYPPEELIRFTSRRFSQVENRLAVRILEIGCGMGANLWFFSREGFSTYGMDCSSTALAEAKRRLDAENLPIAELATGNFTTLPWPDNHFDMVADIEAVVANPTAQARATVAEVLRVLRPGGVMFSKLFGVRTNGSGTGEMVEPGTTANPTEGPCAGLGLTHFYTEEDIRALFSGFAEVSVDYVERSDGGGAVRVHEWVVGATKATA